MRFKDKIKIELANYYGTDFKQIGISFAKENLNETRVHYHIWIDLWKWCIEITIGEEK